MRKGRSRDRKEGLTEGKERRSSTLAAGHGGAGARNRRSTEGAEGRAGTVSMHREGCVELKGGAARRGSGGGVMVAPKAAKLKTEHGSCRRVGTPGLALGTRRRSPALPVEGGFQRCSPRRCWWRSAAGREGAGLAERWRGGVRVQIWNSGGGTVESSDIWFEGGRSRASCARRRRRRRRRW
ncbi:proline-rich receptor-like protein kinase PERK2 [Iris pallida]|uniref:Proline-rich receptor-like protein kinase PERK2 n=1 Tax=Iris pallida TaxID=29817 RepID=A0AAX6FY55_IRIPA|nr:proline-rich receptor-like protein kinase PERK2 [Iris pallida]